MEKEAPRCLIGTGPDALAGGARPWSPGNREEDMDIERAAQRATQRATQRASQAGTQQAWCMAEVDIFCDLNASEMDAMAHSAPMKQYTSGELVYTPHQPLEALFILKQGRIRIFRVSSDGRALTTAIVTPGTIFGEMVLVGQQMHDSFAEALDDVVVCVMSQADVRRLLLGDSRIATRISETLGRRLGQLEQRLSDAVFKSVPERIAGALVTLASGSGGGFGRDTQVRLTHEQLAALAATSRETTTKILGEFADLGVISLGRAKITIRDLEQLRQLADA
jgi:CRP/FNR family transcriptional regulator, cyclic AMP receptor protein